MKPRKNQAAQLGLPLLLAALGAPSLACSGEDPCEAMPDQCVAEDESGTGTDGAEDEIGTDGAESTGADETETSTETTESEGDTSTEETGEEDTGPPLVCGDGEVQDGEACDDGNAIDGDGCDNDCTFTTLSALRLGGSQACALIEGGRVRCWGSNNAGQLGLGHTSDIGDDELPSDAGDLLLPGPPTAISLGGAHACAMLDSSDVGCWGHNHNGQLGNGGTDSYGDDETLADLEGLGLSSVIDVQLGDFYTCALLEDGTVSCWGANLRGQLGYGNATKLTSPGGSLSLGGAAVELAAGERHACVLLENHDLRCWGANASGELGLGHTNDIGDDELPVDVDPVSLALPPDTEVVDLELGYAHSCALLSDGGVMCWGSNDDGQLGLGHTDTIGDDELPSTQPALSLPGAVEQLALGTGHTCALLTGGELMCWGRNDSGQLGLGHTDTIGDDELPTDGGLVELGGSAIAIAAGAYHTCALLEDQDVRCWGANASGELGLGHTDTIGDDELPVDVDPVSIF
ncbi:hypothetical protein G6O69_28670 [Pseudenhygromyxa sp. WMMC2535]|uniref:RCC1 domain-containing protein n=1 Tax=Pseudenhygromyxa sp. WMMC2535 TaxID=2712867 RepID=UPI001556C453|nr:hypothetical protein [Pseudenhygromyxa sp. WMMC2535]NVB41840.1 hypothetical protein [Pseudenhygromyxa sp. WMMC2535]